MESKPSAAPGLQGGGYSWSLESDVPLLIFDGDLENFLAEVQAYFPNFSCEATFDDDLKLKRSGPKELLADVAKQNRRLTRIEVSAFASRESDIAFFALSANHIHIDLRSLPWFRTTSISVSRSDDTIFAVKQHVERFISVSRPWYAALYDSSIIAMVAAWLILYVAVSFCLAKISFEVAKMYFGREAVVEKVQSLDSGQIDKLNIVIFLWICLFATNQAEKRIKILYPKIIFVVGYNKKQFERTKELRKWSIGALAGLVLSMIVLLIKN